ncbi:MAG: SCP2 sterol-binding domain-containing protein [Lachnospiraceae bacterium]|nr:SCP2 sterol-binding domain-containing protein [Lachnospiraceae bacterium]
MTYEEIVAKVKKHFQGFKPASAEDRLAVQVDITGEGEGAFYIEIADGRIAVEPYEYYEHDIKVTAPADALLEVVDGKTDLINANLTGKLHAEGDLGKAEILGNLVKSAAKKASAAKKPAAKKTTAAKKPAAKKTTAAKKPAAKKPAAKKTTAAKKPAAKKTAAK